ncbi:MAG TPA: lipopolysaccharide kinase InaA family protein [Gemmatimonadaceae bacterium]|nr:lipopolysaccharide kinase InaA family protein [Gemmatimonadaceae bacterium]
MAVAIGIPGYTRINANGARGHVVQRCHEAIESILADETLYDYALRQPDRQEYIGRAPAYAFALGEPCGRVVVRHAMRGGLLARSGSDLFFPPTRGLRELVNSLRLRRAGVPTPEVIAVVSYRAGAVLRRSDVATQEVAGSHDLAVVLREMGPSGDRDACLRAAGDLLGALTRAGAHHPDLNARNILLTWDSAHGAAAHILDIDRVRFHVPGDPMVARANLARLVRSLFKLRDKRELDVTDRDVQVIAEASGEPAQ